MATLTTARRDQAWAEIMSEQSSAREPTPFLKGELKTSIDTIDTALDSSGDTFRAMMPAGSSEETFLRTMQKLIKFRLEDI